MNKAELENASIAWFQELGYAYRAGPDIAPRGTTPERKNFTNVILPGRLQDALTRLNPDPPAAAIGDAFGRISWFSSLLL